MAKTIQTYHSHVAPHVSCTSSTGQGYPLLEFSVRRAGHGAGHSGSIESDQYPLTKES